MLEANQVGGRGLQFYHQLVAIDDEVEVAMAMLMGGVALAMFVIGLDGKGGRSQQQGNSFHHSSF